MPRSKHLYPSSFGRDLAGRQIHLQACQNEYVIALLGVRSPEAVDKLGVRIGDLTSAKGDKISADLFRVRYTGLIPVDENGQYTPDPLLELPSVPLRPEPGHMG